MNKVLRIFSILAVVLLLLSLGLDGHGSWLKQVPSLVIEPLVPNLNSAESVQFARLFNTRFQPFEKFFKKYSAKNKISWQLVAAVAYQESHLDPEAQSWTGVRGLMQLTEETAQRVGIEDRTDPEQSISGGSKYLRLLLEHQPKNMAARERLKFALATYNVGPAHMQDAKRLALHLGKNPNSWKDLRIVLPKLADPSYAHMLKYGPARGEEPVEFVDHVLTYLDLIRYRVLFAEAARPHQLVTRR